MATSVPAGWVPVSLRLGVLGATGAPHAGSCTDERRGRLWEPVATGPGGMFDGVRVLELAQFVFVPAAAAVLSDFGADVIKVEHPSHGDAYRGLYTAILGSSDEVNYKV